MSTRRWRGDAPAVAQVDTITPGGTIGTETFTCTINGKSITYTAESGDTAADVAAGLAAAWNNSTIPEFAEITAVGTSSPMTLTHDTPGVPFTVTSAATGSATCVQATSTAATGPNHFNEADNWTGGAVPVDSDDVVFDSGSSDCLYGISQGSVSPASLTITMGYTGKIGLPEINVDNPASPYAEYRTTYLTLGASADAVNCAVVIGDGEGIGSSRIKLNFNDGQATGTIINSGQRDDPAVPPILIKGTHASNEFNVLKGDVGFGFYAGESTTLATLRVGYITNIIGDAVVECGPGIGTITTVDQNGGTVVLAGAVTTHTMQAGVATYETGNVTTLNLDAGTVYYKGTGTITTANVGSGGVLDFRRDTRGRTVTNLSLYEGFEYHDPQGRVTLTNGADFVRCTPADGVFDVVPNRTWTPSSI